MAKSRSSKARTSDPASRHQGRIAGDREPQAVLVTDQNVNILPDVVLLTLFQSLSPFDEMGELDRDVTARQVLGRYALTPGRFISTAELLAKMAVQWAAMYTGDETEIDRVTQLLTAAMAKGREEGLASHPGVVKDMEEE